jgi:hypothetical protein
MHDELKEVDDQATADLPVPPLTDELRRALAEADGFAFEGIEPHDYQKQAAAVRRVIARYVRADVELDVEEREDECCRSYGRALARWLDGSGDQPPKEGTP